VRIHPGIDSVSKWTVIQFIDEKHSQGEVIPDARGLLKLNALLELPHLQLYDGMVGVAATMVLCNNTGGPFPLPPHRQPSRRLWGEYRTSEDEDGRDELESKRETESQCAISLGRRVGDTSSKDGAGVEDCR